MTLRQHQSAFATDVCKLLKFATDLNLEFTFGEVYRTKEQQEIYLKKGLSKTMNSMHLKRLAIDINFFYSGELLDDFTGSEAKMFVRNNLFKKIASYWEELNVKNRAGYTWGWDENHFERFVKD